MVLILSTFSDSALYLYQVSSKYSYNDLALVYLPTRIGLQILTKFVATLHNISYNPSLIYNLENYSSQPRFVLVLFRAL